jgi:FKBP-type peptidyl-prolyl cis-trans isomerase (trigger factor)
MSLILNIIITALASLGAYHIFEEIAWQKHIKANPEEVEQMIDFIESRGGTNERNN